MTIPALPAAPLPTDTPSQFNSKAFAFLAALDPWGDAADALAVAVNADAASANADAATATTQAGIATTKAGEALASANSASASALTASNAATSAAASFDSFDDRYLGAKTSDPTLDNDGNALLTGAMYWNTDAAQMRAYNGSSWVVTYNPAPPQPGGLTYIYTTTAVTATDKQGVLADTSGGSFTVTLPATPSVGAQVVVADAGNAWGTNNLTVARNGSTIGNLAENLVCDITGASVQFVYDGTTWEVYAQIGGQGGSVVTLTGTQTLTNKTMDYNSNTFTNFPAATPFSNNTSLAQVQATALSF